MSYSSTQPNQESPNSEPSILRRFASLVGLLGGSLFFTGWIYQSFYFFYFNLGLKTIELPLQYFFIIPIQVFFGTAQATLWTLLSVVVILSGIHCTLYLIHRLGNIDSKSWKISKKILNKIKKYRILYDLISFNPVSFDSIKFLRSLVDETVVVTWVLIVLYNLARAQGFADFQRDIGIQSTLPVVTLVTPEERLPVGRSLVKGGMEAFSNPSRQGFRYFGDLSMFDNLVGREDNYTREPEPKDNNSNHSNSSNRVWRLLLQQDGWIYLLPTYPGEDPSDRVPHVVAIKESIYGDQMMILSPTFER